MQAVGRFRRRIAASQLDKARACALSVCRNGEQSHTKGKATYPIQVQSVAARSTSNGEEMQALSIQKKEEEECVLIR